MSVVRGTSLSGYPRLVAELGGDPAALLSAAGIDADAVGRYDVFVPLPVVTATIVALAGLSPMVATSMWRVPGFAAVFASHAMRLLSCDHTARQCSAGAVVS